MEYATNALGRTVPVTVNGKRKKPYSALYDPLYSEPYVGKTGKTRMYSGTSKVTSLDHVIERIEDGDTISYPHYYRLGDVCLELVINKLREHGKKRIRILGTAFFDNCVPCLPQAVRDGTIEGIMGNCYRGMGSHLVAGDFLPWVVTGFGHGDRVRKLQTGEERVKMAFGPVPIADIWGNANGILGGVEHRVGPLGLFLADTLWAEQVCLLAGEVSERYVFPRSLSMVDVDFVVKVDNPGNSGGIGSGTLDLDKIRANPFNSRIASQVIAVMQAAGVIFNGFNFQVGSGAGLTVLDKLHGILKRSGVRAGFSIGGITSLHVDMLHDGVIENLLHGQCFEPSEKVLGSMLYDHNHHEISTGEYDNVASKENAVNLLDVAVLSTLELDLNFNANSIYANGRIVGGVGGAQGVAAGSKLTVLFLPLVTARDGAAFPRIVESVQTVSIPGDAVDVAVTEEFVAVNPRSTSPYIDDLRSRAARCGLRLLDIGEMCDRAAGRAKELGAVPPRTEVTDLPVEVVEWRDGTLLDTIFKTASATGGA